MKYISLLFILSCVLSACGQNPLIPASESDSETPAIEINQDSIQAVRIQSKADAAKTYLKAHSSYNQRYAILIDMHMNSGKKRLFVYDLDSMKVVSSGLVAHGSGSNTEYRDSLVFSNVPNSYCTSIGKYKIGASYIGNFGKSYKLHGLDPTNNKAFERLVVLHRYSCVPDVEQPYEICNSLGCPMVSENYFLELDKYIATSAKPVLLEIFY